MVLICFRCSASLETDPPAGEPLAVYMSLDALPHIPLKKIISKNLDRIKILNNTNIVEKNPVKKNTTKKIPPTKIIGDQVTLIDGNKEVSLASSAEIKAVCKEIGMSLKDYLLTIQRGLSAKKVRPATQWDNGGEEDDTMAQLKAALIGLEVEGYIKTKTATTDNSKHTHVTYAWLNQPQQDQQVRDI